ncbi:hypothetical protein FPN185_contig00011-0023 [Flavobacterium psychrophilum]|uniref:hypothetical protein n=1 Tax=Flavobacterium psychrophilum TaxID=96345 RepID=UPI001169974A|nr:hypothetical protein [Flavobacterium psychrophilum]GEJ41335.1 hypothetical protein FPN185_contig00011-0023 [Flavobacterium psychrophilum]
MKLKNELLGLLTDAELKPNNLFNKLFDLFRKTPGRIITQEKYLNRVGFNQTTLNTLLYELKKLYGITDSDIKKYRVEELNPDFTQGLSFLDRFINSIATLEEDIRVKLLAIVSFYYQYPYADQIDNISNELEIYLTDELPLDKFKDAFPELVEEMKGLEASEEFIKYLKENALYPAEFIEELENLKQFVPVSAKQDDQAIEEAIKVFENASTEVKQEIRFRDEFPFINDPELPVELKILVTDKFNHYFAFCDSHKELFDSVVLPLLEGKNFNEVESISNDKIFELAKIGVGNFEMDQLIRDEFVYYRDEHKILGVHPIFKERKLQEFVNNMTIADAAKRATNLENYIRRDTNNAEKATKPEGKIRLEGKVIEWKRELVLVNLKLGIQDAGK